MLSSPFHRSGRLRRQCVRLVILLLFVVLSFDFILTITVNHPLIRVSPSMISSTSLSHKDRIFIASMHWNNELIIRSHWSAALLDLVRHFGAENVYISIIEGGSWDDTKGALRDLDLELEKLGVERSIEMHESTHKDEIERIPGLYEEGWIWTSRDKKELRRIPYLAGIRNQVMDKLRHLAERTGGQGKRSFDKILWLNDVIFTTEDVTTLIATRDGNYAAACSLDFSKPPLYYDTFALRDVAGAKAVTQTWPFFLAAKSRNAMISNSPVPVKSCWNGLVVFQADPFYHNPPLRFRGIPDSLALHHLEGSECCLIHADNRLSSVHGVWLNPNVRVSYNPEASTKVHAESGPWPGRKEKFVGIWNNRWARWTGFPRRFVERYVVDRRIRLWQEETHHKGQEDSRENGTFCLINEMQVLVHDGWAHV
ncbi:glycosyltransferase family 69 protein [Leptodontidium sp. 2 PMI_412]|nr:glycosyltransferase family 69 protein [Leptodontidium sp. 2 PMI_412]